MIDPNQCLNTEIKMRKCIYEKLLKVDKDYNKRLQQFDFRKYSVNFYTDIHQKALEVEVCRLKGTVYGDIWIRRRLTIDRLRF